MERHEVLRALEAILFVSEDPVATADLALVLELPATTVEEALSELAGSLEDEHRGLVLRRVAGGWRLATHPSTAPFLERFVTDQRSSRLTQAALETLAIVAYRQPASKGQIAEIRGVSAESAIRTLLARGLIQEVGRDSGPGMAILYGTTPLLLERLGLDSLLGLPPLPDFIPDADALERMERGLGPGV